MEGIFQTPVLGNRTGRAVKNDFFILQRPVRIRDATVEYAFGTSPGYAIHGGATLSLSGR